MIFILMFFVWQLDVIFDEDNCLKRKKNSAAPQLYHSLSLIYKFYEVAVNEPFSLAALSSCSGLSSNGWSGASTP